MRMLLLVSTVVLLVNPAVASPTHYTSEDNLNLLIDLAREYNKSLTEEFVEDVLHLADGANKCEDKFFCKVYEILHGNEQFGKKKEEKALVRNLKIFVDDRTPNCTELLRDVTSTGVKKPIPDLLSYLIGCIQSRNMNL